MIPERSKPGVAPVSRCSISVAGLAAVLAVVGCQGPDTGVPAGIKGLSMVLSPVAQRQAKGMVDFSVMVGRSGYGLKQLEGYKVGDVARIHAHVYTHVSETNTPAATPMASAWNIFPVNGVFNFTLGNLNYATRYWLRLEALSADGTVIGIIDESSPNKGNPQTYTDGSYQRYQWFDTLGATADPLQPPVAVLIKLADAIYSGQAPVQIGFLEGSIVHAVGPITVMTPQPGASLPPNVTRVVVSGTVQDEEGAPVDAATVVIRSLDARFPYERTTTTAAGAYVFNDVPEGVVLELAATKPGWTRRVKVQSFQALAGLSNTVNFNQAHFISNSPEIVSTSPEHRANDVDATSVQYRLTLSEALNETNRRRFENALRMFPANAAAQAGGDAPTDLDGSTDTAAPVPGGYGIRKGSVFLDDADTRATVSWNAAGNEATLRFNAPLAASSSARAKYQMALVTSEGGVIEDADGNQLGERSLASGSEHLILEAFKRGTLPATISSPAKAWQETHDNVSTFELAQDTTAPRLTGVALSKLSSGIGRIELTFSEPMAAFNGTSAGFSDPIFTNKANGFAASLNNDPSQSELNRFTFMVGQKVGDMSAMMLDGTLDASVGSGGLVNAATHRLAGDDAKSEFAFMAGTGVMLSVDAKDPRRVFLSVPSAELFASSLSEIKVRVEGIRDPAGNNISGTDADAHVVTGVL